MSTYYYSIKYNRMIIYCCQCWVMGIDFILSYVLAKHGVQAIQRKQGRATHLRVCNATRACNANKGAQTYTNQRKQWRATLCSKKNTASNHTAHVIVAHVRLKLPFHEILSNRMFPNRNICFFYTKRQTWSNTNKKLLRGAAGFNTEAGLSTP